MKRWIFAVAMTLAAPLALACSPLLDVSMRPLAGKEPVHLCEKFDGKVLLIVNTASKCGFTPQYEGLEAMHAKYEAQGFSVLGFPSNEFMGQEPGTEEQIKEFCTLTYGVKFPMFEKTKVKGADASLLYKRLKEATGEQPSWNFHKYLVDRNGKVVKSFGTRTKPDDQELVGMLEKLIAEPAPKQ
ncbi:MAG: glutathione peroxidase [Rhodanobacteraceae bacterium]|nr:glutathione peroxidase [Rhodanobacteraceae bacterium]MBL0041968.1 glutathione peroxidase [Xanthomonadales bacterium]MBP6077774.1 glutathione peroxidase [Xanthomonadales bacterium]MBP7622984.1 glutathione peroxidase [Xanthomonadales bacterium]